MPRSRLVMFSRLVTVRRLMFSKFTGGILPVAETRRDEVWISDLAFLHRRHTYEAEGEIPALQGSKFIDL